MRNFKKLVCCTLLSAVCAICLLFWNYGNARFALDEEWSSWQSVDSPASTFWGNIGTWAQDGAPYTGKGSGFTAIYSYTSLDSFGDASQAIETMTNYRVRLQVIKPGSLDPYSKIIIGSKTSGVIGLTKPLQIDVRSYGLDINQFGNTAWNNGGRSISWSTLISGGITARTAFTFEISVTPSLIEIFINGVSRYSVDPSSIRADADVGLFALSGANTTASKGVSFSSIEYATFGPPDIIVPLDATASSPSANSLSVSVAGLESGDLFQVWVLAASAGDGTSPAYSWLLAKTFPDVEDVSVDAVSGDSIYNFYVPLELQTNDGRYRFFVRVQSGDGSGTILLQKNLPVATIAGSVSLDEILVEGDTVEDKYYLPSDNISKVLSIRAIASGDLEEGDLIYYHFMRAGITQIGDTTTPVDWFTLQNSTSNTYSLTIPETGAIHTLKVRIYTLHDPIQNSQERVFQMVVNSPDTPQAIITDLSIGNQASMIMGDYLTINLDGKTGAAGSGTGIDPKFKFMIGEPWRAPYIVQTYGSRSVFDEILEYPGVFLLQALVSHRAQTSFDDGILNFTTVYRPAADSAAGIARLAAGLFTGAAEVSSIAITVNGGLLSADDMLAYFTQSASVAFPLSVGDIVDFDAHAAGLSGTDVTDSDYLFSYWRLDVNGQREVRSWSGNGTLSWRPVAPGHYSIAVRVKGSDALSYEQQNVYHFVVGAISEMDTLTFETDMNSAVDDDTPYPALAGQPVNITATATGGSGDFVYRFEVWDAFLWTRVLQGFSADDSAVWIPRKAGAYRIIVRAQDVSSGGFGDRVVTGGEFIVQ